MTRAERYKRQAEIANRSIAEWPDWMQRSITPPQEELTRLVEKPTADEPTPKADHPTTGDPSRA